MIGVYIHLLACKPEFMRVGVLPRVISSIVESEPAAQGRDCRADSGPDVVTSEDNKEEQQALEVGHGSFIEFYKNGVLQQH